LTYLERP